MGKFRKVISTLIVLVILGGVAGYFLKDFLSGITLEEPVLEIEQDTTTLKWQWDMKVESYKLYDNVTLLDTFTVSEDPINKYTVDFSEYLTDYKRYDFKIVAYIDEDVYKESNVITYLYQNPNKQASGEYGILVNNNENAPANVTYNDFELSWDEVDGAEKYYVCAIYGLDDIYTIEVEDTSLNVFDYMSQEITAFRVGANMGDEYTYFGDMITINMTNVEDVYRKTYYFAGEFNDYYINSSQELISVLYYSFIAKESTIYVQFSPTGLSSVMGSDSYLTDEVISKYIDAITETCFYTFESPVRQTKYKYKLEFDFKGVIEPTNDSTNVYTEEYVTNTLLQSDIAKPYYENYTFSDRVAADTTFATDNQMILVPVETSEELYWCIENGATPTFVNTTCTAYNMYELAKDLLIDTLSDSMSTYEKILSIYDYICYNSVYNYKVVNDSVSVNNFNSTIYKCFYLESMLNTNSTKVAVCDGYSKTFSLLCNMEGIPCYRVTGVARTGSTYGAHAWNKVQLNDKWYIVDITWTEYSLSPESTGPLTQNTFEVLGHKYFMVNKAFIAEDHFEYADTDDRASFISKAGQANFNKLFPEVYMVTRNDDCNELYSYFTHTNVGLGNTTRYITTLSELATFKDLMSTRSESNVEIVLHTSLDKDNVPQVENLLGQISTYGYDVWTIGSVSYSDGTNTIAGKIYIITNIN